MGDYRDTSVAVTAYRRLRGTLTPDGKSQTGHTLEGLTTTLGTTVTTSALAGFARRVARWTRQSFLYRWLTAEPDPEVVVIDLRETYTVGPIVAALDRIVTALAGTWQTAGAGSLARTAHDALRTQPVRTVSLIALVALLTNLAVTLAVRTLDTTGLAVRLVGIALAVLGTRIRVSWTQCTESATYRSLVAALEPPESKTSADDSKR